MVRIACDAANIGIFSTDSGNLSVLNRTIQNSARIRKIQDASNIFAVSGQAAFDDQVLDCSAGSIAKFIKEHGVEDKIKSRKLVIPGKAAVLKGELEERLPGWTIVVAPNEATGLVKFMKESI